jgi:hypothetical protein
MKESNIFDFNTGKVIDMVSALTSGCFRGPCSKEIHRNRWFLGASAVPKTISLAVWRPKAF